MGVSTLQRELAETEPQQTAALELRATAAECTRLAAANAMLSGAAEQAQPWPCDPNPYPHPNPNPDPVPKPDPGPKPKPNPDPYP